MMQKNFYRLILIGLAVSLTACHPALVTTPDDFSLDDPSMQGLDPAVREALRLYPLFEGSTWVYDYLGFDQSQEALWRVVETIMETEVVGDYYVVVLGRTAELVDGAPPENFISKPETGIFRFVLDGNKIYRVEESGEIDLSAARLELVLPFPDEGEGWYPDPDRRLLDQEGETGFRQVSHPYQEVMPPGGVFTCYNVKTNHPDVIVDEGTFCETVGYVYQEFIYFDFSFGYRSELASFDVP